MSNDKVHASPSDLRKLASALTRFQKDITESSRQVQRALANTNWHDQQMVRFEQRYRDLQSHVTRFSNDEVSTMVKNLNALATKLEDIQRMRM